MQRRVSPSRRRLLCRGFTLIELLVSVLLVLILASVAYPTMHLTFKRAKESQLRQALHDIRAAIDQYKRAADTGHIVLNATDSGYPPDLQTLVAGVADAKPSGLNATGGVSAAGRQTLYFLRRIPRDPMNEDASLAAVDTWGLRSYASSHEEPRPGLDVFDVHSLSSGTGLNGIPYREW